ncbi:MAG TPA: zinc ribbon domain-containing protein [Planctomycetaceae bacterium]|nr:zinc ribbon domain-containing protein [Planctomycetaceae bacterium]
MPVYEFYCSDCHMVFNFLSRRINTEKRPSCPRCGRPKLERKISRFAILKGSKRGEEDEELPPGFDESKMEEAIEELAREADSINEEDPRQMARLMRKLFDRTGLQMGESMQEAIRRLEAGEDPDKIEEDMGDLLDDEDALFGDMSEGPASGAGAATGSKLKRLAKRLRPPKVDPNLYDL